MDGDCMWRTLMPSWRRTAVSGLFALDLETGKGIFNIRPLLKSGVQLDETAQPCFNAQSAAPFAIPGVIFAGTTDGHERVYAATDGRILWDFDSASGTFQTINGVDGQTGGSIDVSSGSLADGMLYLYLRLPRHFGRRLRQCAARFLR